MLSVFSGVLQKTSGFPLLAIIGISVLAAIVLVHVVVLLFLEMRKRAKKKAGKLIFLFFSMASSRLGSSG